MDILVRRIAHNLDQHTFLSKDLKQQEIDYICIKDKKKDMWRAIASWFHVSYILTNVVDNIYYQFAASSIQWAGQNEDPLGLKDI